MLFYVSVPFYLAFFLNYFAILPKMQEKMHFYSKKFGGFKKLL